MHDALIASVTRRFRSYDDLIAAIESRQLRQKLDAPRHKSLLERLWCVVGARESYAQALSTGAWGGFACSMTQHTHDEVVDKLKASGEAVLAAIASVDDWTSERDQLPIELAEHEVMHEGGIIRHMYAFELDIPASVKWA